MKSCFFNLSLSLFLTMLGVGCKTAGTPPDEGESSVAGAANSGKTLSLFGSGKQTTHYCSSKVVLDKTTYVKPYYNPTMGPGHFHCRQFNSTFNDNKLETAKYIALSDQIKEINWCDGAKCYPNDGFCGKKVKVKCTSSDQNCKVGMEMIVTITDFCPVVHPDRKANQTPPYCGDGQTVADISDWVWDYFRQDKNENNLKLTFERLDKSKYPDAL